MVLTPQVFVWTLAALWGVFVALAFAAELIERRDERWLREECHRREMAEWRLEWPA